MNGIHEDGRNGPPIETDVLFRYRVQKVSAPIRVEKLGAFEVGAIANGFRPEIAHGINTLDGSARFALAFGGKPIVLKTGSRNPNVMVSVGMLAQLPSQKPALLAYVDPDGAESFCVLLVADNGTLREQRLAKCANGIQADELTTDSEQFAKLGLAKPAKGRTDRHTYANSSLLLMPSLVLNVKTLAVSPSNVATRSYAVPSVSSLAVAPDQGSFARFHNAPDNAGGSIVVIDFVHNTTSELPIDAARMRWADFSDLTPTWTLHHFEWKRGDDGTDVLAARKDFVPIPYHGDLLLDGSGTVYRIKKGGPDIRLALIEYQEKEFGAKRETVEADAYDYPVIVNGQKLMLATTGDNEPVHLSLQTVRRRPISCSAWARDSTLFWQLVIQRSLREISESGFVKRGRRRWRPNQQAGR